MKLGEKESHDFVGSHDAMLEDPTLSCMHPDMSGKRPSEPSSPKRGSILYYMNKKQRTSPNDPQEETPTPERASCDETSEAMPSSSQRCPPESESSSTEQVASTNEPNTSEIETSTEENSLVSGPNETESPTLSCSSACEPALTSNHLPDKPYQPVDTSGIPPKKTKTQLVYFQTKWFKTWPWLHYSKSRKGVLCFKCTSAYQQGLLSLANKKEDAFISAGFQNWKKVTGLGKNNLGRFHQHESSETHKFAAEQLRAQKRPTVVAQVDEQASQRQEINRRMLVKVYTSVKYLARQGLALRGHTADEGNFHQLLRLRAEDDPDLTSYTARATNYTSPQGQNEMLQDFSNAAMRHVADVIRKNKFYAVMVDGTQDITGAEQESICIRHVDDELNVHEDFIGLYEAPSSSGEAISTIIEDVIIRLGLSIDNLRAQTYDGASNMSGKYAGCQAKIKSKQPLAMFFHCSSHVSNLVMQHAVTSSPLVRDALQWVQDLGTLYRRSGNYKTIFKDIASELQPGTSTASIRPLCPTRWLCRQSAVESVVNNYKVVLDSLETMAQSSTSDTATKANGLLDRFQKGEVLLALRMVNKPLALLETLNAGLQARTATMSGIK
ncbi:zinc finger MYM-type protein 1-like [Amphiura filiformis]|uniref:zinc finger MYM-type protein 1-like n=1 Tax=Amphiura filiformis TaxID=82378 RepID=UPI003B20E894